jgi:hypothetical protein
MLSSDFLSFLEDVLVDAEVVQLALAQLQKEGVRGPTWKAKMHVLISDPEGWSLILTPDARARLKQHLGPNPAGTTLMLEKRKLFCLAFCLAPALSVRVLFSSTFISPPLVASRPSLFVPALNVFRFRSSFAQFQDYCIDCSHVTWFRFLSFSCTLW